MSRTHTLQRTNTHTSYHIMSFAKVPLIRSTGAPQYTTIVENKVIQEI